MIYTISSVHSFSDLLASHLLQNQTDEWGLSKTTLIVPTRRAAKTIKEAFLRQSSGKTLLLPKITPISDIEMIAADLPEAISPLKRQLLLMRLIQKAAAIHPEQAFGLAASLAELLDEMAQFDIPFERLDDIVPDMFSEHWQQTLRFLEIIRIHWPRILKELNQIDPTVRQIKILEKLTQSWHQKTPIDPIIAVGFTGGFPYLERFLKEVNLLPKGDVFLPNLDLETDEEDWNALDETHPQYHLKKLLKAMGLTRADVKELMPTDNPRKELIERALKPASRTHTWLSATPLNRQALQNLTCILCKGPETEAMMIALNLRKVLETPGKTAALVTTDRDLARRVTAEMRRWHIQLDDSAGTPLSRTNVGTFLLLLAEAAHTGKAQDLLALLKHPLTTDGASFTEFRRKVHFWEKEARLSEKTFQPQLQTDLQSFFKFFINPVRVSFSTLLQAHLQTAECLAASSDKSGPERLWHHEDGEAAAELLTTLTAYADQMDEIEPAFYPSLLKSILNTVVIRPKYGMHPRLDILGPIEARLQHPDVFIIAGLNEGTFPELPDCDPWLSRPMRHALGMRAPEEKIGISAHDFSHAFLAPEVILTRSLKNQGTPTIPSRWLSRLEAVLEASGLTLPVQTDRVLTNLFETKTFWPAQRPQPTPPVDSRPNRLSITQVETWMRDPYSIYAKHILKLRKLPPLDEPLSIKNYGIAVHQALEGFLKLPLPEQTLPALLLLGQKAFEKAGFNEASLAFWKPKFERTASWFFAEQEKRTTPNTRFILEKTAHLPLEVEGKTFELYGKADRIDIFPNNTAEIIDYKTGTPPRPFDVKTGYAPQLVLEGIFLMNNGFEIIPDNLEITDMSYWKLSGTKTGGEIHSVLPKRDKNITPIQLIEQALNGLKELIAYFNDEGTPYPSCPDPKNRPRYNDYEHLARLQEWLVNEENQE